ncbi:MAG: 30S ribosomal protein S12 methylthiotransferase RimO [Bdellovibrionales bacterium]|nr:30S ribosomal protein S12 methylthiotransferase RimO [Bdellovibrionales bacterium]
MSSKLRIVQESSSVSPVAPKSGDSVSREFLGNVSVVNLGCAKNQVDSEVMLGSLQAAGFHLIDDPNEADIAVVNTCGFLQPAVEEGIDTILDLSELKGNRLRKLIVVGCMVERYGEDLKESLPEVDHFLGGNDLLKIIEAVKTGYDSPLLDGARPYFIYDDTVPRMVGAGSVSAYVKIAEGCDRPCAFCIIPKLRGDFRSRPTASIITEINDLARQGIQEVNLVAQDLTAYGADRKDSGEDMLSLLRAIDSQAEIPWVRLFYAYPLGVSKELMLVIKESERVVNYLDIPLQHASERILKFMKRPLGKYSPRNLTEMMRTVAPEVALRTTFIVGHPGETENDVEELANLLREIQFEHVGIFEYSREEGTPSHDLPDQVSEEEKKNRRSYLMEVQQEIQEEKLSKRLGLGGVRGETEKVLLLGTHPESDMLLHARAAWQGPEVDGEVIINDLDESLAEAEISAGMFGEVEYTEVAGYDLVGRLQRISG